MNGNPEIIIKLFDTLKDATDKNERTMQTLIGQQQILVDNVKHLPITEIKDDIKDHVISARKERGDIAKQLDKVDNKVTKMIITVVVAFTILTGSYVFVRNMAKHDHEDIKKSIIEEIDSRTQNKK